VRADRVSSGWCYGIKHADREQPLYLHLIHDHPEWPDQSPPRVRCACGVVAHEVSYPTGGIESVALATLVHHHLAYLTEQEQREHFALFQLGATLTWEDA
jgi:hypothetical protein